MRKLGFRYLPENLPPGHKVRPKSDHFWNLSADKQKAEAAIRAGDSRGQVRSHAVFVFENRDVAMELLHETDGKHLYELSLEEQDILSRSDLRIYDEIVEALKQNKNVAVLVREFWDGVERPAPRIELTIAKAVIQRKLVDDDQK
jgi:hypothetical protein